MKYKILIGGEDYTSYLAIPININRKNDSTLYTATLSLINTTKSDKFFQATTVEIQIDDRDIYSFIVASDDIVEVVDKSVSGNIKYNHNISLIDRFKLCERYNLPSFAVSKHDTSYVLFNQEEISIQKTFSGSSYSKAILGTENNGNIKFIAPGKDSSPKLQVSTMKSRYKLSQARSKEDTPTFSFTLDPSTAPAVSYVFDRIKGVWDFIWVNVETERLTKYLVLSWKAEFINKSTNKVIYTYERPISDVDRLSREMTMSTTLYDINRITSLSAGTFYWRISLSIRDYNLSSPSQYDQIYDDLKKAWYFNDKEYRTPVAKNEVKSVMDSFKSYVDTNIVYQWISDDIEITDTDIELPPIGLDSSLADVCEKAFDMCHLRDYNTIPENDTTYKPVFELDKSSSSYYLLQSITVPEMIFEKQTLAEVLRKLGKLINGIPRITSDDKIYYDILTDTIDNPLHNDDPNNLKQSSSSLENYATTMVSDVSNLVPSEADGEYAYWPAKGCWGKYLSEDQTSAWLCPDNAAIRIDSLKYGGIYRVLEFNIKNLLKNNSRIIHLIQRDSSGTETFNRLITKELYDSLSNSDKGLQLPDGTYDKSKSKLRNIYYTPKDSVITINALSEAQRAEFFGTKTIRWAYCLAAIDAYNNEYGTTYGDDDSFWQFNDLNNVQFQVKFIPIINTKYVGEQSNIEGLTLQMESTYSQEDTNPTSNGFGALVDNYLKRLGNDDISKNEIITDINRLPYIGEYLNSNSSRYYCDNLSLVCYNNYIAANLNYTKNYNKINALVANPKDYVQYDIPLAESVRRIVNLNDYIYIRESTAITDYSYKGAFEDTITQRLYYGLSTNSGQSSMAPLIGYLKPEFESISRGTPVISLVPIQKFYSANGVKFQMNMYDNYTVSSYIGDRKESNSDKFYENYIPYADKIGEARYYNTKLLFDTSNTASVISSYTDEITRCYPLGYSDMTVLSNSPIFSRKIRVDKDKKEALSFVFNIHAITDIQRLDIQEGFVKAIFNEIPVINSSAKAAPLTVYGYTSTSSAVLTRLGTVTISNTVNGNSNHFLRLYYRGTLAGNYDGWVIKKGNVEILRKEQPLNTGEILEIDYYIYTRTEKVKTN